MARDPMRPRTAGASTSRDDDDRQVGREVTVMTGESASPASRPAVEPSRRVRRAWTIMRLTVTATAATEDDDDDEVGIGKGSALVGHPRCCEAVSRRG